jgi:cysteine-rich repeat protein
VTHCFCQRVFVLGNSTNGGFTVNFTTAIAVDNFLPVTTTTAGFFLISAVNPSATAAGSFAAELLTALMNIQFSSFLPYDLTLLRFSTICTDVHPLVRGRTLLEIVYIANQVISSGFVDPIYAGFTPAILTQALALYNENFVNCSNINPLCFTCNPVTSAPTLTPTTAPSNAPTAAPSFLFLPTAAPTTVSTGVPTGAPTVILTSPPPTLSQTPPPSFILLPTAAPTFTSTGPAPTAAPTVIITSPPPTNAPTPCPTLGNPAPAPTSAPNAACCGNGIRQGKEECDLGSANNNTHGACTEFCTLPKCGDGVIHRCNDSCVDCGVCEADEDCDDGNLQNGDGCSSTCRFESLFTAMIGASAFETGSGSRLGALSKFKFTSLQADLPKHHKCAFLRCETPKEEQFTTVSSPLEWIRNYCVCQKKSRQQHED